MLKRGLGERLSEALLLLERAFIVHELVGKAAVAAAHIRLEYGISKVGSLILATVVEAGYTVFYTFGSDFKKLNSKAIRQTAVTYLG